MSPRLSIPCVALSFVPLTACRTAAPAAEVDSSLGVVRADTEAGAAEVRDDLEELVPLVRGTLPGTRRREVDVWVQDRLEVFRGFPYPEQVAGMADFDNGRIHVRAGDDRVRLHLAHELVHVLVRDEWKRLPGVLEEGVCDLVAVAVVPERGREQHVKRLVEACSLIGGLRARIDMRRPSSHGHGSIRADVRLRLAGGTIATLEDVLALRSSDVFLKATGDDGAGLYGMGYLVAGRVVREAGFEALHEMCRRAEDEGLDQVPPAWILEASRLDGGNDGLRRAVLEEFGAPETIALVDLAAGELAQAVADIGRELYGDMSVDEFLRDANPCFSLASGAAGASTSAVVALRQQQSFRDALAARW
jgi:hypothetical protein